MKIEAIKFPYKYMEYEKDFTLNEIAALFPHAIIQDLSDKVIIDNINKDEVKLMDRLTYVQKFKSEGNTYDTLQGLMEQEEGTSLHRQHTRYSTHGIHEYKGKYNPQVVCYFMNYFKVFGDQKVLDPFNGSGTTILECAHMGISATGADINPMACYIANAKVAALQMDVNTAYEAIAIIENALGQEVEFHDDAIRMNYLMRWIPLETLSVLECIRNTIMDYEECYQMFFLMVASDLIREYSNQEPRDLRIRKRFSPFPEKPFFLAFKEKAEKLIKKIEYTKKVLNNNVKLSNTAVNCDIRYEVPKEGELYDIAITSPPYATALPYIDTQRISLVWLGLCSPEELASLEAKLIGSRELLNKEKMIWKDSIENNLSDLPEEIYNKIIEMNNALSSSDGFRKQAVPSLLYRYFSDMKLMFKNVLPLIKVGGKYALIVGHNKTTLGEQCFYIDTPQFLGVVAEQMGWRIESVNELQTYKRYGINKKNAINNESLIVLERRS